MMISFNNETLNSCAISFVGNPYYFGDAFCVPLYTLSNHFCDNFFVRRQFYQILLKLPGAFNLQLLY